MVEVAFLGEREREREREYNILQGILFTLYLHYNRIWVQWLNKRQQFFLNTLFYNFFVMKAMGHLCNKI